MLRRLSLCLLLAAAVSFAAPPDKPAKSKAAQKEAPEEDALESPDDILQRELSETSGSPSDVIAVLERHLKSHPDCPKRNDAIRVLALVAVQQQDRERILKYGGPAIEAGSRDPKLIECVTRTLLDRTGDPESLRKALDYSMRLADELRKRRAERLASKAYESNQGRKVDEGERTLRQTLTYAAHARSLLGQNEAALASIEEAWPLCPSVDTALERARILAQLQRYSGALNAACDALMLEDPEANTVQRQTARERIAEYSAKLPAGSSDARLLEAWDRTHLALEARRARLREFDPNLSATSPLDFVMTRLDGQRYPLSQLKGKVVVFDFWATWCGPCRVQHPLYDIVKAHFKSNPDVVFLNLNTDEDRSLVEPFLERLKWSRDMLYDEGLGNLFRVNSIPTTVVLGRDGQVASRMGGFVPERFVDMLTERIGWALARK